MHPSTAQFCVDGRPIYPQRERNFARSGLLSGGTPRGEFTGKMIVVQNAHDAACWPNAALSYRRVVERNLGDALGDHYRLWFNDHAAHLPASINPVGAPPVPATRLIDYGGSLEQALRDLMAWVEDGVAPPAESGYTLDTDQQLRLAPVAAERGGIQPVVHASANGADRAEVAVGELVALSADVDAPPGGGTIIGARVGLRRHRCLPVRTRPRRHDVRRCTSETTHAFDAPGTYFPCVRVTAHRDGDVDAAALPAPEPRPRARRRSLTWPGRACAPSSSAGPRSRAWGTPSCRRRRAAACSTSRRGVPRRRSRDAGLAPADVDGVGELPLPARTRCRRQAVATALGDAREQLARST